MQEQQDRRSDGSSVAPAEQASAWSGAAVESAPSDELWRAAVFAARQAAITAAELRRAFDGCAAVRQEP